MDLWDKGQYYSASTKGDSYSLFRSKHDMEFLISYVLTILCSLGCINISSALGLFLGSDSIIRLISCSRSSDLQALGENLMSPPSLSLCQIKPL